MGRNERTLGYAVVLTLTIGAAALGDDAPILVIDPGGHKAKIKDVMFTRDGRHLVSAGDGKVVRVCHAGAVLGDKRRGPTDFTRVLRELNSEYKGLVTFAASTGREVSVEKPEWKNGAFTEALLEGLSGKADGFGGSRDGVIDSQELGNWVVRRVQELTGGEQHAVYFPSPELPPFPLFALEEP